MVIIDSVWNEIKVDNITNKNMDFFFNDARSDFFMARQTQQ